MLESVDEVVDAALEYESGSKTADGARTDLSPADLLSALFNPNGALFSSYYSLRRLDHLC